MNKKQEKRSLEAEIATDILNAVRLSKGVVWNTIILRGNDVQEEMNRRVEKLDPAKLGVIVSRAKSYQVAEAIDNNSRPMSGRTFLKLVVKQILIHEMGDLIIENNHKLDVRSVG